MSQNTLPDEVKEKMLKDCVGVENYYPKEGKHIIHINKIDLFNLMEEYAKAYAPVPGKEESVEKALEIWENNIPKPLAELLSDFAMNHTYPVRGIIRNLLSKIIYECSPASASTKQSNESLQQAAKEYAKTDWKNIDGEYLIDEEKEKAFLAGASFNSDAVEFALWINREIGDMENTQYNYKGKFLTTQELYNLFLVDKNKNNE